MNNFASGGETEKKAFAAKAQSKAQSSTGCSFCWFVLALYPTLKGMKGGDDEVFRQHLKSAHGLRDQISA